MKLSFRSVGTDGSKLPTARGYLIKQSPRPIRTARDFARAGALCKGSCTFQVARIGARVTLTVTGLRARSVLYYAVAARDNVSGHIGPRSTTVRARIR